ncbi:phBC6A51 family helix-turn-helix protein [Niallia sp. 01092]|uniref:phBC6A51 family helix-turn-helix protein n=1 Tax=Niallia sp. 01092 TaxID=3457759 RepID=UPI003FCFD653
MDELMKLNELGLTEQQDEAACLLAYGGMEKQMIAKAVGVSRTTLYKWEKKPEFIEAVDIYKRDKKNVSRSLMLGLLEEAVKVQAALLKSEDESIRLKASDRIVQHVLGKPSSSIELTTNLNNNEGSTPKDILEMEDEEFERKMLEEYEDVESDD